ncbi:MAG: glycoside hydrolase family 5 protein [Desulfobacterales bacterium]|nr:glycoside hydrolase family 5 protein [Desulfobacterales bacterium]
MKKPIFLLLLLFTLAFFISSIKDSALASADHREKAAFWNEQRKGTNFFNNIETLERFQAAKKAGIEVVRLAPNKWLNGRTKSGLGDFLIGDAPTNSTPIQKDVDYLITVLDKAQQADIKVVLTMLSLPGNRWTQHNNGKQQRDIWRSFDVQNHAIQFWTLLAEKLKDHPALVGYNIKNEPTPEKVAPRFRDWYIGDYAEWYRTVEGTPADLNLFYSKIVKSIRQVDKKTPIILDSGFYATPWAFKILKPLPQKHIIYSFHMYEPYPFTSARNRGKYEYPGKIPTGEAGSASLDWNKKQISEFLKPIRQWQNKYGIPNTQIFAAEFGVFRYNKGASQYLKDIIQVFESNGWHWAFYSFREDDWHGMDYELGTKKPGWAYWKEIGRGVMPDYSRYKSMPIFDAIQKAE